MIRILACLALLSVALATTPHIRRVMHVDNRDDTTVLDKEDKWSPLEGIIQDAIANHVFPGAVAGVADESGFLYLKAFGSFTYGDHVAPVTGNVPPMTNTTQFDMASLTKVVATTTAAMYLYQQGQLDLDMVVCDPYLLGPGYANNGKDIITVRNLLLHNAGYPPDPVPNYWDPAFKCPQTSQPQPAEDFSCQDQIYTSLLNQTLINPVGAKYVYSDISMITMMFIIGKLARTLGYIQPGDLIPGCDQGGPGGATCYYEAFVRSTVLKPSMMASSGFRLSKQYWGNIPPTWNDTLYQRRQIEGTVSDGNSYANGGISGHAGLFSTVPDTYLLMHRLMFAGASDPFVNSTTVKLFTTVYNTTQSSRALGWDTNANVNINKMCGQLSNTTYTHTGFTGTQICNDPQRKIMTFLFTNRVYDCCPGDCPPCKVQQPPTGIIDTRRSYNDAIASIIPVQFQG